MGPNVADARLRRGNHDAVGIDAPGDFAPGGAKSLTVSTVVGVESAQGDVWRAQVTYVSDRLVGLRGWTIVDGRFRERDTVTLLIGEGDRLVSGKAQVLAAGGSLMRIVRRDASEETERRLAPRLRVDLAATVTVSTSQAGLAQFETDVVDLSASGCAIRADDRSCRSARPIALELELAGTPVKFAGIVVRTWVAGAEPHAGVQFDPMPSPTIQLLNRFLVDQLRNSYDEHAAHGQRGDEIGRAQTNAVSCRATLLRDAHELGPGADAELLQDAGAPRPRRSAG